jgi:hypothetical protein
MDFKSDLLISLDKFNESCLYLRKINITFKVLLHK